MSASRSFLSQAKRKVTARCWPDWRVEGVAPGQAGQRLGCREPLPAVADLGQQGRRAHPARPGQAGEEGTVGMQRELLGDARLERLDLVADRADGPDEREGHRGHRVGASRRSGPAAPPRAGHAAPSPLRRPQ